MVFYDALILVVLYVEVVAPLEFDAGLVPPLELSYSVLLFEWEVKI